ncbi:MAG: hypothetical protein QNJ51_30715 [Calothrix sp. MO_167.B12]|nr:hypothetical protein [Calothrix sp. MO_167.B12]
MSEQVINNQSFDNCEYAVGSVTGDAVMSIYYQGNKFLEQSIQNIRNSKSAFWDFFPWNLVTALAESLGYMVDKATNDFGVTSETPVDKTSHQNTLSFNNCEHAVGSVTGDAVMNIFYFNYEMSKKMLHQSNIDIQYNSKPTSLEFFLEIGSRINSICENFLKEGLSEAALLEEVFDIAVSKYPDGMNIREAVQSIPAITEYAKYQAKQEVNEFAKSIFNTLDSMGLGKVKKKEVVGIFKNRIETFFVPNTDGSESISEISENQTSFWDCIDDFVSAGLRLIFTKDISDDQPRNEVGNEAESSAQEKSAEVENEVESSAQEKSAEVGKEVNKEATENGGKQLETSNTVNREGHIVESEPESLQSQESEPESQNEYDISALFWTSLNPGNLSDSSNELQSEEEALEPESQNSRVSRSVFEQLEASSSNQTEPNYEGVKPDLPTNADTDTVTPQPPPRRKSSQYVTAKRKKSTRSSQRQGQRG